MTPYFKNDWTTLFQGDCREVLKALPDESVNCVVTSPPYWGLRDYGTARWEGGSSSCDHKKSELRRGVNLAQSEHSTRGGAKKIAEAGWILYSDKCGKCGAVRIDSQIGLEESPAAYVEQMVEVFREVRRVLRTDGTAWLNLGDSYAANRSYQVHNTRGAKFHTYNEGSKVPDGFKPKDLIGIPWAVAKALRDPYYAGTINSELDRVWLAAMLDAEGCIFIHKRKAGQNNGQGYQRLNDNYAPGVEIANTSIAIIERVMQLVGKGSICSQSPEQNNRRKQTIYRWNLRTTECKEFLRELYPYLVAKQQQARIAYNCPSSGERAEAAHSALKGLHQGSFTDVDFPAPSSMFEPGWYLRSDIIWNKLNPMPESVTDRPTKAHEYIFLLSKSATYYYNADAIREPNASPAQLAHNIKYAKPYAAYDSRAPLTGQPGNVNNQGIHARPGKEGRNRRSVWTISPTPYPDAHFATFPPDLIKPCILAGCPVGGVVLDPFAGSGTTLQVAMDLQCKSIGIELNADYCELIKKRFRQPALMFGA